MAVAPVLERKIEDTTNDELHNARIKDIYAKLINPNSQITDIFGEPVNQPYKAEKNEVVIERPVHAEPAKPYLVENARANSPLFRADSVINAKPTVMQATQDEEENEDLRPTQTTIQYKTAVTDKKVSAVKTAVITEEKVRTELGKKEKIIIASFIGIVVALFALAIINAAIIANLDSGVSVLQSSIESAKATLSEIDATIANITDLQNIENFAESHNLFLVRGYSYN